MKPVLSVRQLSKKIKKKWIVQNISFDIMPGEIFGFLGPNGAGKTTTIRMLVDLIRPTSGDIYICGENVQKNFELAMRYVGSIVENPELYPYLTGWENLEHFAVMVPGADQKRIREVIQAVGMDERIHDKVKTYSLGMRQRLGIAQALLGRPKLLILDEPTNGLDPQGIRELRAFVRSLADDGMSVFISSHLLSEIQMMCDRVAVIRDGKLIGEGVVKELLTQTESKVAWEVSPKDTALRIFKQSEWTEQFEVQAEATEMGVPVVLIESVMDHKNIPELNRELALAGVHVFSAQPKNKTLEDLFLELTRGGQIG